VCEGTGKAIATGELGAVDVVMVHAVDSELKAVANGSFINRSYMMYNYFVIIGPENDPAEIRNASSAADAFNKIAAKQSAFISRGDSSGLIRWKNRSGRLQISLLQEHGINQSAKEWGIL